MLNLKVRDLPLRGRGFTLWKAAGEKEIKGDLIDFLAFSIYPKYEEGTPSYELPIPSEVQTDAFKAHVKTFKCNLHDLETAGLVTVNGEVARLTEKAEEIFNRANDIRNKLDEENFHFCPCCLF